jgi:hypothetical protein
MTKNSLTKSLLISVVIGIGFSIYHETKTVATTRKPAKVSPEILIQNIENKNLVRERKQHNTVNTKNNSVKSASQQLVGGWTQTIVYDSGDKEQATVFFEPDGSWYFITTKTNGDWYITARGTWQLSDGILSQEFDNGNSSQGSLKFTSNNEYYYQSENSQGTWTRINSKSNLSAEQLLGTWSIVVQDRISGNLIDDFSQRQILKLIELNPDDTFRYESSDVRFPALGIKVSRSSGTWEYVNAGYADGILLLKDSQGQLVSIGSVNWSSNGKFLHIHRSQYDPSKNQYTSGRIEYFNRTDLRID